MCSILAEMSTFKQVTKVTLELIKFGKRTVPNLQNRKRKVMQKVIKFMNAKSHEYKSHVIKLIANFNLGDCGPESSG